MKFVTFRDGSGSFQTGVLYQEKIYALPGFTDMSDVIARPDEAAAAGAKAIGAGTHVDHGRIQLMAPLMRPARIFGIGLNYASHASESQMKVQAVPTVFMKLSSSVVGPDAEVVLPTNSTQPDYEAELGVVIGRPGYRIAAGDWQNYVFGYTIVNDISARDVQLATSQWTLGKSFPSFTPLGPAITTRDEVADPHTLSIQLTLDGEVMQQANTRDLIFKIPQLIEYISSVTPLEAGDIISTGTPEGVGMGRKPQRWLRSGEEMVITIEGLGELRNRTVAEKVQA